MLFMRHVGRSKRSEKLTQCYPSKLCAGPRRAVKSRWAPSRPGAKTCGWLRGVSVTIRGTCFRWEHESPSPARILGSPWEPGLWPRRHLLFPLGDGLGSVRAKCLAEVIRPEAWQGRGKREPTCIRDHAWPCKRLGRSAAAWAPRSETSRDMPRLCLCGDRSPSKVPIPGPRPPRNPAEASVVMAAAWQQGEETSENYICLLKTAGLSTFPWRSGGHRPKARRCQRQLGPLVCTWGEKGT